MASDYTLKIDQGATLYKKITWKNPDSSAINTVDFSAKMQIRTKIGGTLMQSLSTVTGEITISDDGIIELKLTPIQTSNITCSGVYDLEVISPTGTVTRLLQGSVILSPAVTTNG